MRRRVAAVATALAAVVVPWPALAAEVVVLSGGAVEPGLRPAIEAFERATGHTVRLSFAPAPLLRAALRAAPSADVLIAPDAVLDEAARDPAAAGAARMAADARVPIGRVGVGVAVRDGAELPDVSSADALRTALDRADAIVFNRASTGVYVEKLLPTLPIAAAAAARVERFDDGASVLRRIAEGRQPHEIGFAAVTEILLFRGKGVRLVGPLPAPLQNETGYAAVAWRAASPDAQGAAAALLRYLAGDAARETFQRAGIASAR